MSEYSGASIDIASDITDIFTDVIAQEWPEQYYRNDEGELALRPARQGYKIGDPNLPVSPYRELIVDTIDENIATVIESPTGTGKSTQIAQWLMESGKYTKIYETQPRVVAARSVAEWIRITLEPMLGEETAKRLTGWQTAPDSDSSIDNLISIITDGIQIQREIHSNGLQEREVLLIDECHEKSENIQILMLIAKKINLHVAVMSATIDADKTAAYYANEDGEPAPIVSIEARTYPIIEHDYRVAKVDHKKQRGGPREAGEEVEYDIKYRSEVEAILDYAKQGKDILLFVPQRKQIDKVMGLLAHRLPAGYVILGLHGEQTPEQQRRSLADYPNGKLIISTSVGQTSLTPKVDVVLDGGFDRTSFLQHGRNGLDICDASVASRDQRRGRCGRTKDGIYELVQLDGFPVPKTNAEVMDFGNSETRRKRPDDLLMKLGRTGLDAADLIEAPKSNEVQLAYKRLTRLGAIAMENYAETGKNFSVTEIGDEMLDVPLEAPFARMFVESYKYSTAIQVQMAAILAVQQAGGVHARASDKMHWQKISKENGSDLLLGLDLFIEAMKSTQQERESYDIVEQKFRRAKAAYERLVERLDGDLDSNDLTAPTDIQRAQLQACMVTGIDEIFHYRTDTTYSDSKGRMTKIAKDSQVQARPGVLIAGTPYNLVEMRSRGRFTNRLAQNTFTISAEMLLQHAPERVTKTLVGHRLTPSGDVEHIYDLSFDGDKLHKLGYEKADTSSAEARDFLIDEIFDGALAGTILDDDRHSIAGAEALQWIRREVDILRNLQHRTSQMLGIDDAVAHMKRIIRDNTPDDANTLQKIAPYVVHPYVQQMLPDVVVSEMRRSIHEQAPDTIALFDERTMEYVDIPVVYDKNIAYLTVAKEYYPLLGATIPELGDRIVRVRPEGGYRYADLETARTQHQSRGVSRGGVVAPEETRRRRAARAAVHNEASVKSQTSIAETGKQTIHYRRTGVGHAARSGVARVKADATHDIVS